MHQDWVDKITDDFPKVMHVIEGSRLSYGDDMGGVPLLHGGAAA